MRELPRGLQQRGHFRGTSLRVNAGVERAVEALQAGQRIGGVEIVLHRFPEWMRMLGQRLAVRRRRELFLRQVRVGLRQRFVEILDAAVRLGDGRIAEIDRMPVMRREQECAQRLAVPVREQVPQGAKVAERLAHLLGIEGDEAVMQPVARQILTAGGLALGDLVLVVWEDQVLAAAVHVECGPEVLLAHRRALDVPPRASRSPGALPGHRRRLARLCRLPESEIQRVALLLPRLDPRSGLQIVQIALRELAVTGEGADCEVDVALRGVGIAALDQARDQGLHLRNVIGGLRFDVRRQDPEHLHVAAALLDEVLGKLLRILPPLVGAPDDLVVDVGPVADVGDVPSRPAQEADGDVEGSEHPGVADVGQVVDRDAADVDPDASRSKRPELLLLVRQGVEDAQRHVCLFRGSKRHGRRHVLRTHARSLYSG